MAQEIATPHAHLSWIRAPLDELLETASTALQSAAEAEAEADREPLDQARSALQRASATLKLLDLPGAATTAHELRDTVEQVMDNSLPMGSSRSDTIDRLLGGTVILHDYLDHLESGSTDQSVALLPLLNDLRAIRGAHLISEGRYFLPDLDRPEPHLDLPEPPAEPPALAELHRQWQTALRDWLRGTDPDHAVQSLAEVARSLRATINAEPERRMWLFAQALLLALQAGAIRDSISLRRCLARLDLLIRRRLNAEQTEDPDQLARSLLFLVAVARAESGPARNLVEHYELDQILKVGAWEQAQGSTRGRNTELMHDVAEAAADELRSVKSGLNDQIDAPDPATLGAMSDTLHGLAYSLDVLAMEHPVRVVRAQADRLAALQSDPDTITEDKLLDVAEQLVSVEMQLKASGQPAARGSGDEEMDAGSRELRQARLELYAQVVRGLDQAQQELDRMVRGESESGIEAVLKRLQSAGGALGLAQAERAAAALDGAQQYLRERSSPLQGQAEDEAMKQFADILATIEQYVIALRDRQRPNEQSIEDAAERVSQLADGAAVASAPSQATSAPQLGEYEARAPDTATADINDATTEPSIQAFEGADPEPGGDQYASTEAPDQPASQGERPELDEAEPVATPEWSEAGSNDVAGSTETGPDDSDDIDLNQVLSGEIGELIDSLRATLPPWSKDPDDRELLTTIRRCFHTLKGSARTLGADAIGEFGWRLESLLNEALEGRRQADTTVAAVAEAVQAMPAIRDSIDNGDLEALPANAQSVLDSVDELEAATGDGGEETDTEDSAQADHEPTKGPRSESVPASEARADAADRADAGDESAAGLETAQPPADSPMDAEPGQPQSATELPDDPFGGSFDAETAATAAGWWLDESPAPGREQDFEAPQAADPGQTASGRAGGEQAGAVNAGYGETPAEPGPGQPDDEQPSDQQPGAEQARVSVAANDDKLLRLIASELEEHVEVLEEYLQRSDERGWAEIPDAGVLRAVHTSASTTSLSPIGAEPEALRAVEHYLQQLQDQETPPPRAGLEVMHQAAELIRARIASQKPGAEPYRPELDQSLLASARKLLARSTEAEDNVPAQPPEQTEEPKWPAAEEGQSQAIAGAVIPVDYAALDQDVLEVFLDESGEVLPQIDAAMSEWRESQSESAARSLRRSLHTLKGSARMTGLTAIGDLSHELESLMDSLVGGQPDDDNIETLQHGCDQLHSMVEAAGARQPLPAPEIVSWRPPRAADQPADEGAVRSQAEAPATPAPPSAPSATAEPAPAAPAGADAERSETASSLPRERLRVDSELIDRLSNAAGEVSIFRSRLEQQINEMNTHITEVARTITRLREQLRQMDMETETQIISKHQHDETLDPKFDPLELDRYSKIQQLSRALTESVSDLTNLQEMLDNSAKQSETILLQQSRINTDLQEGLLETRMVPFNSLAPRLRQLVRNTANEVGVEARLEIKSSGAEGELDRHVLDRITAPIEHILRNAVVHGIEPPEQRRQAGKPEQGQINIEVTRDATDLVLEIEDDGGGIDPRALRDRARAAGLLQPGNEPDDRSVLQYIFHSGLSTAESLTELAGRGVGLDVVSNNVRQLGGSVAVESDSGRGTRLTLRLPLTLAVMQAILVQAGERSFAVPLSAVSGVSKMDAAECRQRLTEPNPSLEYGGRDYPLLDLARLLGVDSTLPESGAVSLLMVESGGLRAALLVSALLQHDEFVVKPVGPQISSIPGILAGTITGDGSVVVILDIGPLLRKAQAAAPEPETTKPSLTRAAETQGERRKPVVLVVDDSITIRKVTARVLEQSGMEALTAKDGMDALEVMQQRRPDAILLDIEMPRMDGYELATHIRNDQQLKDIPIMIISSRTGEKHREQAREYDINDYLGKPYQEEDLLQRLRVLLADAPPHSSEARHE